MRRYNRIDKMVGPNNSLDKRSNVSGIGSVKIRLKSGDGERAQFVGFIVSEGRGMGFIS